LRLGASLPILTRMEDRRNILFDEMPFSYKLVKDKKAIVYYKGKEVFTAVSKDYNKLQRVIAMDNAYELQLFLAKITGNFKRGNERG
jgi:hypothetical protein